MYRLNVPYREKDLVKALGARWNPVGKFWYCEELTDDLKLWYDGEAPAAPAASAKSETRLNPLPDTSLVQETLSFGEAEAFSGPASFGFDPGRYRSVSEVNGMISQAFFATSSFRKILVKGEVTNYNGVARPHYYFSIKDAKASLSCRLWAETARTALKFKLENGQQVAITGRLEYYEARGEASLIVSEIYNIGEGAANLALLQLKNKLEAEGIFAPEHKKEIPKQL